MPLICSAWGLKEMLADEITSELRRRREAAIAEARAAGGTVTRPLMAKGVLYGSITVNADGTVDTTKLEGVAADLRVRPCAAARSHEEVADRDATTRLPVQANLERLARRIGPSRLIGRLDHRTRRVREH